MIHPMNRMGEEKTKISEVVFIQFQMLPESITAKDDMHLNMKFNRCGTLKEYTDNERKMHFI